MEKNAKDTVKKIVGNFTKGAANEPNEIIGNITGKVPKGESAIEKVVKAAKD